MVSFNRVFWRYIIWKNSPREIIFDIPNKVDLNTHTHANTNLKIKILAGWWRGSQSWRWRTSWTSLGAPSTSRSQSLLASNRCSRKLSTQHSCSLYTWHGCPSTFHCCTRHCLTYIQYQKTKLSKNDLKEQRVFEPGFPRASKPTDKMIYRVASLLTNLSNKFPSLFFLNSKVLWLSLITTWKLLSV